QRLWYFGFDASWATPEAVADLSSLGGLGAIKVSGPLSADAIRSLSRLTKVSRLVLFDPREWSAAHGDALEAFSSLRELHFRYGTLEDDWFEHMPRLPGLKLLGLSSSSANTRLTAKAVQRLATQRPDWKVVWNEREIKPEPPPDSK